MQKISFVFCLLVLLCTNCSQAQKVIIADKTAASEWGKITQEDLDMKVYPLDSSADAVVLDNYGTISVVDKMDYKSSLQLHKRIKFLKTSGFTVQSKIKIRYHSNFKYLETFKNIRAQIIYANGSRKILKNEDFLDLKIDNFFSDKIITFKDIEIGCILEYEYELRSNYPWRIHDWFFQEEIPSRHSDVKIIVPHRYGFVWGKRGESVIKETKRKDTYFEGSHCSLLHFVSDSLPALKSDTFLTSINNYLTSFYFQVSEVGGQGEIRDYLTDWKEFADFVQLNYETFALPNILNNAAWNQVKDKITSLTNDSLKIKAIHQFVKTQIIWDKSKWFVSQTSVSDAFKEKKGNSADINILLYALLKRAGINAYPVILGTRSQGLPMEKYPVLNQFNYVICYCKLNGKPIFLDATNPLFEPDFIQPDALNNRGLLLDKDKTHWIDIIPQPGFTNRILNLELDDNKHIAGSLLSSYKGYDAYEERQTNGNKEELDKWAKKYFLEAGVDAHIDSTKFINLKDLNEAYKTTVHFKIPDAVNSVGDVYYINPTFSLFDYNKSPFKENKRNYPIEFPYPERKQFVVNLKIPDGFTVSELPKPMRLVMPNSDGLFQYNISVNGSTIQCVIKLNINRLDYPPENYKALKDFFDQAAAKVNEQIVLKKK